MHTKSRTLLLLGLITITVIAVFVMIIRLNSDYFRQKFERSNSDVASQVNFDGSSSGSYSGSYSARKTSTTPPSRSKKPTQDATKKPAIVAGGPQKSSIDIPGVTSSSDHTLDKPGQRGSSKNHGAGGLGIKRAHKLNKSKKSKKSANGHKVVRGGHIYRQTKSDPHTLNAWGGGKRDAKNKKSSRATQDRHDAAERAIRADIEANTQRELAALLIREAVQIKEEFEGLPTSTSGDDEEYDNHGVNPMTHTSKDRLSTFSIDVDTGSYTIARRKIREGVMPPASSVRVEEFVNYFDHGYEDPTEGAFSVSFDGAPSPFRANVPRHLIRIGVQGDRLANEARKPMHLVFLVDVSGSMNAHDKLGLIKKSLHVLVDNLKDDDTVALITYAANTKIALSPTKASESVKILEGILNLKPGGGTSMGNGMETAYKMAIQAVKPGHVSRVVVLSDGDANIGASTIEDVLKDVQTYVDEGVTLSTIGFGMGNYKDNAMEQLANKGNGNYYYIDSKPEASKVFGEQLLGTMQVIAKDVKIQVEFNPEVVSSYRLVGYENRDIADKDFRNDKVDAGEIGAGHNVTAFYEVEFTQDNKIPADATMATVRIRHKKPDGIEATEQAFPLKRSSLASSLLMASPGFQFAVAVVGFAEQLRGSPYVRDFGLNQILTLARKVEQPNELQREFITLVERAGKLR